MSATLKSQEIVKQRKRDGLSVYNFGLGANPMPISKVFSKNQDQNPRNKRKGHYHVCVTL